MSGHTAWRAGLRELSRPGETPVSDQELRRFKTAALSAVLIGTNVLGAVVVLALLSLNLVPPPHLTQPWWPNGCCAA